MSTEIRESYTNCAVIPTTALTPEGSPPLADARFTPWSRSIEVLLDAIAIPSQCYLDTASRNGQVPLPRIGTHGPQWSTIHQAKKTLGRPVLATQYAIEIPIIYSSGDDGRTLFSGRNRRH